VIAEVVPPAVSARDTFGDAGPEARAVLFPAEAAAVAGVHEERRREFTTARGCARAALAALGLPPAPLVPGPLGAPRWPDGVVGSMTHCCGYRAAAVARATDCAALGIDAEPALPLPVTVAGRIVSAPEERWLRQVFPARDGLPLDRLLFCAKEAAYKAFSPWAGALHGFRDFTVLPSPDGTFRAVLPRLPRPSPVALPREAAGRWTQCRGHLLAVLCLPTVQWQPAI
jgi:4'-phosphopantetheinyl transferase EntD